MNSVRALKKAEKRVFDAHGWGASYPICNPSIPPVERHLMSSPRRQPATSELQRRAGMTPVGRPEMTPAWEVEVRSFGHQEHPSLTEAAASGGGAS